MPETERQTAERHVREGNKRILRQAELIKQLETDGRTKMLREAEQLLADLQALQEQAEEHLRRLQAEGRA
jgi:hypothetical protein